jgi:cytidine deaminase
MTDPTVMVRLAELTARARLAQANAYAPYSNFRVGAALLCADGAVVDGCNVENASYPAGICAERVALGAAVASGHRSFSAVVIVSDADTATPPCGICRQALAEFGLSVEVIAVNPSGAATHWTLDRLLPDPFTPSSLQTR